MTRLLTSKDIAKAMGCNQDTARKYMRKMIHIEEPLRVTEAVFDAWVNQNSYKGSDEIAEAVQRTKEADPLDRIPRRRSGRTNAS